MREADRLVIAIMRKRGYPTDDFDQRAADVSVDHPDVVEHYREAHQIAVAHERGDAGTEDLRQAAIAYRSLVVALLDDDRSEPTDRTDRRTHRTARRNPRTGPRPATGATDDHRRGPTSREGDAPDVQPRGHSSPGMTSPPRVHATLSPRARAASICSRASPDPTSPMTTPLKGGSLIAHDRCVDYHSRWDVVQGDFIDEPAKPSRTGTRLSARYSATLRKGSANPRTTPNTRTAVGRRRVDHGDLRIALRRYRTFFDRLLSR